MHLKFCPLCKKVLELETIYGEKFLVCSCGYKKETHSDLVFSEKETKVKLGKGVAVEKKNLKGFPHKCSKCGYGQSEVTDLGASYSDESDVYLFKCKKCGYTERQADGTGN
ncbi:MAG: hypothetical protein Q7S33_05210 [Nanoarchaeota archaeon]|nr:hypothetical protein [Nanoarchaeota archaeon]